MKEKTIKRGLALFLFLNCIYWLIFFCITYKGEFNTDVLVRTIYLSLGLIAVMAFAVSFAMLLFWLVKPENK